MCMPHYLVPNETDRFDANFYRPERKVERQLFFWHNFFCKTLSVQTIKKEPAYPDLLRTGPCALKSQISSFRIVSTPLPSGLCCVTGEFTTVAPRGSGNAPSWHAGALPFVDGGKERERIEQSFNRLKLFTAKSLRQASARVKSSGCRSDSEGVSLRRGVIKEKSCVTH